MQVATTQATIGWEAAAAALRGAVEHANALSMAASVAVVDRAGVLVGYLRMPGAPLHSADIAIDKAYTAASFGLPTGDWSQELAKHSAAVIQGLPLRPRLVMFGGGLPLMAEGQHIGGIGVSGGLEQQDVECAKAGLAVIGL